MTDHITDWKAESERIAHEEFRRNPGEDGDVSEARSEALCALSMLIRKHEPTPAQRVDARDAIERVMCEYSEAGTSVWREKVAWEKAKPRYLAIETALRDLLAALDECDFEYKPSRASDAEDAARNALAAS